MLESSLSAVLGALALVVAVYYSLWTVIHLLVSAVGVRSLGPVAARAEAGTAGEPLTIAVPAYNERETVVETLRSLLEQPYPLSVVFVDDGSTDGTFEAVAAAYDLVFTETEPPRPDAVRSADGGRPLTDGGLPQRGVFEATDEPLTVVRQENRGKSAALNRALELCETPLFGVVDADTVVEPATIRRLATQFADEATVAAGGSFRVSDAPKALAGTARNDLSTTWFGRFQALEQLRVFVLRQVGRAQFGTMTSVLGACCMFRTDLVRAVDGFAAVETEDFELAVALRRHCVEVGRACRCVHVPNAVAWTTVPQTLAALDEQRQRWIRGVVEVLARHRAILGRPAYGRLGTVALPYIALGEVLWLSLEGIGLVLVPLAWGVGALSTLWLAAFLSAVFVLGPAMSALAIYGIGTVDGGYDRADQRTLLVTAVVERLCWRPAQVFLGVYSVFDFFRR